MLEGGGGLRFARERCQSVAKRWGVFSPEATKPPRLRGLRVMERAGLEPATPSLQIRSNGGLGGLRRVGSEESSGVRRAAWSALVTSCRRDLTRI